MECVTDWVQLWRELVEVQSSEHATEPHGADRWAKKAKTFDASVNRRWAKPDASRDFVIATLDAAPGSTLLDIGAGTGTWAILLASHAKQVTAVEPSPAMREAMQANIDGEGVRNIQIVADSWPGAAVEPHDFTFCSHAMYACPDLPAFIRATAAATRRTCFLILRAPNMDGIMAEAARHLWGHPYDSPNFQVAYNVLLQMGILPNVQMEQSGTWSAWTSPSLEDALADTKRRLGVKSGEHDPFLMDLLNRRLTREEDRYVWPRAMRSALVYWNANS